MSVSNHLENKLLNHVFKNTAYTPPTSIYMALFTSDPGEDGTGTEVTGGAYARKAATFNTATSGSIITSSDITYDIATANWGTITHVALYDAVTGGNILVSGTLTTAKTINTGDQLKINAGDITIYLD
jgi:hypothetical protein